VRCLQDFVRQTDYGVSEDLVALDAIQKRWATLYRDHASQQTLHAYFQRIPDEKDDILISLDI
jgi:hypothetical protein